MIMKSKTIKSAILLVGILGISIYQIHSSSGGASTPRTGAPSETTCTSCHNTYSVQTSGTKHDKIKLIIPFTGGGYIPDSTYRVTITYRETNITKYGFQITALNSKNEAAGTFSNVNNRVQTFSSTVSSATRFYAEQTSTGTSAVSGDSVAWIFEWKAPSSNVGNIKFYLALNVSNGNGGVAGDYIYNKTFTVSPSSLLPKAKAVLQSQPCSGVGISFNADSVSSSSTYSWRFLGGATPSVSTAKNPSVVYSSTGAKSAILEVTNSKGKSKPDTINFTVLTGATLPTLNVGNSVALCKGDTVKLSVSSTPNHGYIWSTGKTGTEISTDTAGIYYVTAIRTNGCERRSSDITILTIPKPDFKVLYGFSGDTICAGEPLLLFTQDKNGFSDSYSLDSKIGPFVPDSLFVVNIGKQNKTTQVWSKSKGGCVQGPISKSFFGLDTVDGPNITVKTKYIDKITFRWTKISYATEYRYSIDNGNTWNTPLEGKLSDSTTIDLTSASQKIIFWIQARTSKFCGISKISKITSGGLGCNDIVLTINSTKDTLCYGDTSKLTISGLPKHSKWSIKYNGKIYKDSIFELSPIRSTIYTFAAIDSTQASCGFYEKQIRLVVDSVEQPKLTFNPPNNQIICGGEKDVNVELNLNNNSSNRKLIVTSNWYDTTMVRFPTQLNLKNNKDSFVYHFESTLLKGCKSKMQYFSLIFQDSISTDIDVKWLNNFNYTFKRKVRNQQDLVLFEIRDKAQLVYSIQQDSFVYDLSAMANKELNVHLWVSNGPCKDSSELLFNAYNLNTIALNNHNIRISPNPISHLDQIWIQYPSENEVGFVQILSMDGKVIVQKTELDTNGKIRNVSNSSHGSQLNLADGIYLIELLDKGGRPIKSDRLIKISN